MTFFIKTALRICLIGMAIGLLWSNAEAASGTAEQNNVLVYVNRERAAKTLPPLKLNEDLNRLATAKSKDMRDRSYFSHTSPVYGTPFQMFSDAGLSKKWNAMGENIAKGQPDARTVVNAWMKSRGHRKNILNPHYTELGVGYVSNSGQPIWTQIFAGKTPPRPAPTGKIPFLN